MAARACDSARCAVDLTSIPNLGEVEGVLTTFRGLLLDRAAAAYEAPRFALGAIVVRPAETKEASYAELLRWGCI